jgi:multicomponent Na+:H+ antiporter subunit E
MVKMGTFILRLTIWFLLTANLGIVNLILGLAFALLLPRPFAASPPLGKLIRHLGRVLIAIPQAYYEAVQMMIYPHNRERIFLERATSPNIPALVFLDIFLITFTPKTLVIRERETGEYEIHSLERSQGE